jgi:hypothetical protein
MITTVTVQMIKRDRFRVQVSIIPGRVFGDWTMPTMVDLLRKVTTLSARDALDLVLESCATGDATRQTTTP